MANITTGNPIYIDTAGAILSTPVMIQAITFYADTAGDQIVIKDYEGDRYVADLKAGVANASVIFTPATPIPCPHGINVTTLSTGGYALIYI